MLNKIRKHRFVSAIALLVALTVVLAFIFFPYNIKGCKSSAKLPDGTEVYLPVYCKPYSNFEIFIESVTPKKYL